MSTCKKELSEREKERFAHPQGQRSQRLSAGSYGEDATRNQRPAGEETETDSESKDCGDTMVSDLEQKVQRSKRDRRNSLHRTQLLESQMKTVRGELVGTLDHLEELRNILRRSQQKSEEREAAMQKLAAGLR